MNFKRKKISTTNNTGKILQDARYKTGLSLKMVAKHILIDKKYLEALEKENWHKLPGEVYAKNFLKKYCDFLNLDINQLNLDFSQIDCFKNTDQTKNFHTKTKKIDFLNSPKILKSLILFFLILLALTYFIWQINQITAPPQITLFHPITDLTLVENSITISGKTNTEIELTINNSPVFLDQNNHFSINLNLQPGLNIIRLEGKKRFSKTQIIERKIIVE